MKLIKQEESVKNKSISKFIKDEYRYNVHKKDDFYVFSLIKQAERKNKLIKELKNKLFIEEKLMENVEVLSFCLKQNKCKDLEQNEIEIIKRIRTTTQPNGNNCYNFRR